MVVTPSGPIREWLKPRTSSMWLRVAIPSAITMASTSA
jgi:hypothetical protein